MKSSSQEVTNGHFLPSFWDNVSCYSIYIYANLKSYPEWQRQDRTEGQNYPNYVQRILTGYDIIWGWCIMWKRPSTEPCGILWLTIVCKQGSLFTYKSQNPSDDEIFKTSTAEFLSISTI